MGEKHDKSWEAHKPSDHYEDGGESSPIDPESKNDGEIAPDAAPRWQLGFFVGYAIRSFNQQHAIFIHGIQNDQRRLREAG